MSEENNARDSRQALRSQLAIIKQLRKLAFDDPSYEEWRVHTGQILDQIFGQVQSEQHPCTKAFLNYRIPEHFTATREQMQEYYRNILNYQADLLKAYLDDTPD
jgi:hypothetical protein